jgi:hypothetical protein
MKFVHQPDEQSQSTIFDKIIWLTLGRKSSVMIDSVMMEWKEFSAQLVETLVQDYFVDMCLDHCHPDFTKSQDI